MDRKRFLGGIGSDGDPVMKDVIDQVRGALSGKPLRRRRGARARGPQIAAAVFMKRQTLALQMIFQVGQRHAVKGGEVLVAEHFEFDWPGFALTVQGA